jgi:tetratricopeptide (TPR) repeat protein
MTSPSDSRQRRSIESGRLDEAEALYRQSIKLWEALEAGEPANVVFRSKLALTEANLAMLLEKTGRISEAERSGRRAALLRASLTKDFPNTPWHFVKLAEAHRGLARLQIHRGDFAEARRLQEQAVAASRAALAIAPENVEYRHLLASECASLAETLISLKKHDEATRYAAEFASLSQDSAKETLRAGSFMAQCVPLAAADAQLPETQRAQVAEVYATRAIGLVREAVAKGYRDGDAIRNDRSFDSVRARSDFGALLARFDKSAK